MKLNQLSLILAVIAIAMAVFSYTSQAKYAYVESNILIDKYKGAKEAREKFETESKVWQSNVKTLATELDSLKKEWIENQKKWSKSKKKSKQEMVLKKQEDFARYSQAINQKAAQREQELMKPIYDEMNNYIADYAEENGYDMIFGTLQGNIVYSNKTYNLTKEVTKYINEQY